MILTFLIICLITFGGTALTYLYEKEDTLLARLAAGNIIGSVIFGLTGFLFACFFGLSVVTAIAAIAISLLPLVVFRKKAIKYELWHDWQKAKGKMQGANLQKGLRFAYYAGIFILLWFFFERAMIETENGIFTGGSQNLGDLPFHLGAIFSFSEGNNFPPENPSFAFAKFTYPFMADFLTASLVKLGANVRDAMLLQNVFWGFSLVVLLEKFTVKLTENKLAGRFAPLLLLFCGGLGFMWFAKDYWQGTQSFFDFLFKLPQDYTIRDNPTGEKFRWGNSLVVLFLTQRSLLLGMPLTLIALTKIWQIFSSEKAEKVKSGKTAESSGKNFFTLSHFHFSTFLVGLLAGTLPLVHVHSLVVLFVVCAFLFFFQIEKWREWVAFAVGVSIIAVPELVWAMTGSATRLSQFIDWHFGWDAREDNFFFFWIKNLGLFIPLLLFGIYLIFSTSINQDTGKKEEQRTKDKGQRTNLLLFYIPFAFLFLVANTVKLAPWEWDNIKVLIYWFIGSIPFVAWFLVWFWEKDGIFKAVAVICLIVLTSSGALDVWRTASGQISIKVFDKDAVKTAELIKKRTPPDALFLNAPTYNSAIVLSGRQSLMRYSGHLASYGIDYAPREDEVRRIYEGTALADSLLKKNGIEYVIISPEERGYAQDPGRSFTLNEEFFSKFPIVTEVGQYRVYQIKK